MSASNHSRSGVGFIGLLTVAFVVLKLCGIIAWSWWWVLSPLWINAILVVVLIVIYFACCYLERPRTPAERAIHSLEQYRKTLRK